MSVMGVPRGKVASSANPTERPLVIFSTDPCAIKRGAEYPFRFFTSTLHFWLLLADPLRAGRRAKSAARRLSVKATTRERGGDLICQAASSLHGENVMLPPTASRRRIRASKGKRPR